MAFEPEVLHRAAARLRVKKEQRLRERYALRQTLYQQYPELLRLDAELRGTMAEVARLALSGGESSSDRLAEIRERNLALQEERAALLAHAGYGPDDLDDTPACPKCRDTGWDGAHMCSCLRKLCAREQIKQLSSLLDLEGQSFETARMDVYSDLPWRERRSPRENMARVFRVCEDFSRQFPDHPLQNLFFSGGTGLGKTFLSACIARAVSERGFSVVYDTAISVFGRFDARKFARDSEQEREAREGVNRYLNCDLLILDDLGSEMTTALTQSALYELVNSRLGPKYRTIISSNLSMEDIRARYTPQIASRLEGTYRELTFYGDDIRLRRDV